jgi:hypothetical protein
MFSRMLGSGKGFFRSCTLGRAPSSSKSNTVANIETNAMTSKTGPCRASTTRVAISGPNTNERSGFISNLALQMGADEVPPGIHVKKKWSADFVIAIRALCHRQNSCQSRAHFAVVVLPRQ